MVEFWSEEELAWINEHSSILERPFTPEFWNLIEDDDTIDFGDPRKLVISTVYITNGIKGFRLVFSKKGNRDFKLSFEVKPELCGDSENIDGGGYPIMDWDQRFDEGTEEAKVLEDLKHNLKYLIRVSEFVGHTGLIKLTQEIIDKAEVVKGK